MLLFTVKYYWKDHFTNDNRQVNEKDESRSLGAPKGKFRSDEINVRETDETKLLPLRSESLEKNLESKEIAIRGIQDILLGVW